jgi:hypothetical protein
LTGLGGLQSSNLFRSAYPAPFGTAAKQNGALGGMSFSVQTDTSDVTGNAGQAANQSVAAAAGSALDDVNELAKFAQAIGGNSDQKPVGVFTIDRSGKILSEASLDGDGDLSVYGSGSSGGATSEIEMYVPAANGGSDDWSAAASNGLAQAAYTLNSLIAQVSSTHGKNVNGSA